MEGIEGISSGETTEDLAENQLETKLIKFLSQIERNLQLARFAPHQIMYTTRV